MTAGWFCPLPPPACLSLAMAPSLHSPLRPLHPHMDQGWGVTKPKSPSECLKAPEQTGPRFSAAVPNWSRGCTCLGKAVQPSCLPGRPGLLVLALDMHSIGSSCTGKVAGPGGGKEGVARQGGGRGWQGGGGRAGRWQCCLLARRCLPCSTLGAVPTATAVSPGQPGCLLAARPEQREEVWRRVHLFFSLPR